MYLLRKYQMLQSMNLLCLHLLNFSGVIASGAQSHLQHLSGCLVVVHRMTSSAVCNVSVWDVVLQSLVLSGLSSRWGYLLRALGYCGENVVGAFGV